MATGKQVYRAALDRLKVELDNRGSTPEAILAASQAVATTIPLGADAGKAGNGEEE